jgi:hypothetical protein
MNGTESIGISLDVHNETISVTLLNSLNRLQVLPVPEMLVSIPTRFYVTLCPPAGARER